ncbi:MAG: hypothetical protein C0391_04650 [Anaerolinea sp.]|nr:hypothetical protein [Anaerolinea sp.]
MDGDLGRHLTVGNYILESGIIPVRDVFSHTLAGKPFTPHEWLSEVMFSLAYQLLSLSGVVLLSAAILAFTWYIIAKRVAERSGSFSISFTLIIIGIAASSMHWLTRPHLFTYLFLAIWIGITQGSLRWKTKFVLLAGIMILWVNSHGAFIAGVIYLGLKFIAGLLGAAIQKRVTDNKADLKHQAIILAGVLGMTLLNPVGKGIYGTVTGFLSSRYLVMSTLEYQPPNLFTIPFIPFLLYLIIAFIAFIFIWKKVIVEDIIQVMMWIVFGLVSARNIPLAVIVGLPIISKWAWLVIEKIRGMRVDNLIISGDSPSKNRQIQALVLPIMSILIAGGFLLLSPVERTRNTFQQTVFPVNAVDYLSENPIRGNVFNEFAWGGYLLFRLWPEQKVFIDGQTDFYGENLTREYSQVINGMDGYQGILNKYLVNWVIINKRSPLTQKLAENSENWQLSYEDELSIVFTRKAGDQ